MGPVPYRGGELQVNGSPDAAVVEREHAKAALGEIRGELAVVLLLHARRGVDLQRPPVARCGTKQRRAEAMAVPGLDLAGLRARHARAWRHRPAGSASP